MNGTYELGLMADEEGRKARAVVGQYVGKRRAHQLRPKAPVSRSSNLPKAPAEGRTSNALALRSIDCYRSRVHRRLSGPSVPQNAPTPLSTNVESIPANLPGLSRRLTDLQPLASQDPSHD